jgi:hypothetical protein
MQKPIVMLFLNFIVSSDLSVRNSLHIVYLLTFCDRYYFGQNSGPKSSVFLGKNKNKRTLLQKYVYT